MSAPPRVVVLTPVYNEDGNLEQYRRDVTRVLLDRDDLDCHVLFIDDGSSDRSWEMICRISAADDRFTGIRLSRNYGSHTALSAGFLHTDGDAVATLACDLQDPPETVLEFVEHWRSGAKIVWGARRTRGDSSWRVATSRLFQRLLRRYAMPSGSLFATGSFFLIDRKVLECVRQFHEHNRITFALVAWTGFDQARVEYDRRKRVAGTSGWSFAKMLKTMYDAFVGFSTLPIRVMTMAGFLAFVMSLLLTLYLLIVAIGGTRVPGWTSQMLLLSVFFGVQFSLMAITGEYLYRIYTEVVRRPLFFVSERTAGRPTSLEDR